METLINALRAAVDEASFDLERARISSDGQSGRASHQRVSAAQLREAYLRERDRAVTLYAEASVPEAVMKRLIDALRRGFGEFIHPDTDRIGHAFPVDGSDYGRGEFRSDGLRDDESQSPVSEFVGALVRAAAVMGVEKAAGLLAGWRRGEPVDLYMCTVLSGLALSAPASPREDVRIVPLALTTAELPRLPMHRDVAPGDCLGLCLLRVRLSASPALFPQIPMH